MDRITDLTSYDTSPHGLSIYAHATDQAGMPAVEIQLTHTDLAFVLSGMVDRYGLDNVRRAIDCMAQDDPTGKCVGLTGPAIILEKGKL